MKMDKGLDTGAILSQVEIPIADDINAGELFDQLAELGANLLVETLPGYLTGDIAPQPQDETLATYAPRLKKADGKLDFSQSAAFLACQVRAYHPWPGSFQFYNGTRLIVNAAHAEESVGAKPGQRLTFNGKPAWGTGKGLLVLDTVQAAGKNQMTGEDFLLGAKDCKEQE